MARAAMFARPWSGARKFLAHDIAILSKSFEFFDNEPDMISFTKLSREELERILCDDAQEN